MEELGRDLRVARMVAGLTLREVGVKVGVAASTILTIERAHSPGARPELLARHAAAVGMRVRIKAYPEGPPIRDAAQIQLIRDFRARLGPNPPPLNLEQPVIDDRTDRRAFDATMDIPGGCGLEFITRFHDCQAQLRAALLKQRDSGMARLVIVVKATNANRRAVAAVRDVIAASFPGTQRAALTRLARLEDPGANGLVFV
jgi:transcriptional regulator with XRE-family HTH domain